MGARCRRGACTLRRSGACGGAVALNAACAQRNDGRRQSRTPSVSLAGGCAAVAAATVCMGKERPLPARAEASPQYYGVTLRYPDRRLHPASAFVSVCRPTRHTRVAGML